MIQTTSFASTFTPFAFDTAQAQSGLGLLFLVYSFRKLRKEIIPLVSTSRFHLPASLGSFLFPGLHCYY